jgi:23S rRNA (uracil1939-C5)-methyltransferase
VASVALSRRRPGSVQLLGVDHELLLGPAELRAQNPGARGYHYAAHGAFRQVHADTARAIAERVLEQARSQARAARGPLRVLELYAGSGALALALAEQGAEVCAVESFEPACVRLGRAAGEQGLPVEVRPGDAAEALRALAAQAARFELVIVNPPRRGLDLDVRRLLARLSPERLIYVSCQPATLARDLAHLARCGLRATALEPFDMMPLTDQVETLASLEPGPVPAPIVVAVEARGSAREQNQAQGRLIALNKPPHEPTTPQGEHASSLLTRLQALPGYERAVPLHRLDVGTSGVCLFARAPEQAGALSAALAEAHKSYLALVKGVVHKRGRIERPLVEDGRTLEARTRYQRLSVVRGHSLVRVEIETGRTHQIRRHFAGIGHPVIGDGRYGDRATLTHFAMRHGLDRPFLHCARIGLSLPHGELVAEVPLAPDLAQVLESLRAG